MQKIYTKVTANTWQHLGLYSLYNSTSRKATDHISTYIQRYIINNYPVYTEWLLAANFAQAYY